MASPGQVAGAIQWRGLIITVSVLPVETKVRAQNLVYLIKTAIL